MGFGVRIMDCPRLVRLTQGLIRSWLRIRAGVNRGCKLVYLGLPGEVATRYEWCASLHIQDPRHTLAWTYIWTLCSRSNDQVLHATLTLTQTLTLTLRRLSTVVFNPNNCCSPTSPY